MATSNENVAKNLRAIDEALKSHDDSKCPGEIVEIRMHPIEVERLDFEDYRGIPIVGYPHVPTGRFRLKCSIEGDPTEPKEATEAVGTVVETGEEVVISR